MTENQRTKEENPEKESEEAVPDEQLEQVAGGLDLGSIASSFTSFGDAGTFAAGLIVPRRGPGFY